MFEISKKDCLIVCGGNNKNPLPNKVSDIKQDVLDNFCSNMCKCPDPDANFRRDVIEGLTSIIKFLNSMDAVEKQSFAISIENRAKFSPNSKS